MQANYEDSISKPVSAVFNAIVDHRKMCNYFISTASGPIEEGKTVKWEWADVGASLDIKIKKVEANRLIQFEWSATGTPSQVEIKLEDKGGDSTAVTITEGSWDDTPEGATKVVQQSVGWTHFFLCLKAYLLFHVNLRTGRALAQRKSFL